VAGARSPTDTTASVTLTVKEAKKIDADAYRGKQIEIAGVAKNLLTAPHIVSGQRKLYIELEQRKDEVEGFVALQMECLMQDDEVWKRVSAGSEVTLRGHLENGSFGSIRLADCTLIATSGPGAIEISASDFIKSVTDDVEGAKQRFHERSLVVHGTFQRLLESTSDEEQFSSYYTGMHLEGIDGRTCPVHFPPPDIAMYQDLKPGDKVSLIGLGVVENDEKLEVQAGIGWGYRLPE
jgi:hypothetical protein